MRTVRRAEIFFFIALSLSTVAVAVVSAIPDFRWGPILIQGGTLSLQTQASLTLSLGAVVLTSDPRWRRRLFGIVALAAVCSTAWHLSIAVEYGASNFFFPIQSYYDATLISSPVTGLALAAMATGSFAVTTEIPGAVRLGRDACWISAVLAASYCSATVFAASVAGVQPRGMTLLTGLEIATVAMVLQNRFERQVSRAGSNLLEGSRVPAIFALVTAASPALIEVVGLGIVDRFLPSDALPPVIDAAEDYGEYVRLALSLWIAAAAFAAMIAGLGIWLVRTWGRRQGYFSAAVNVLLAPTDRVFVVDRERIKWDSERRFRDNLEGQTLTEAIGHSWRSLKELYDASAATQWKLEIATPGLVPFDRALCSLDGAVGTNALVLHRQQFTGSQGPDWVVSDARSPLDSPINNLDLVNWSGGPPSQPFVSVISIPAMGRINLRRGLAEGDLVLQRAGTHLIETLGPGSKVVRRWGMFYVLSDGPPPPIAFSWEWMPPNGEEMKGNRGFAWGSSRVVVGQSVEDAVAIADARRQQFADQNDVAQG